MATTLKDLGAKADKAVAAVSAANTAVRTYKQAQSQALADSKARELNQTDVDALGLKLDTLNTALTDLTTLVNAA